MSTILGAVLGRSREQRTPVNKKHQSRGQSAADTRGGEFSAEVTFRWRAGRHGMSGDGALPAKPRRQEGQESERNSGGWGKCEEMEKAGPELS